MNRRAFMIAGAAGGGGLLLGFGLWRRLHSRRDEPRPDAYIQIGTDGLIVLMVDESEMGQGVSTALPMILAEELDADWSTVKYEQAPVDPTRFGDQWTASSTSVRSGYLKLCRAGAAAREMLVAEAAQRWSVPASECVTQNSVVSHPRMGETMRYAELSG